MTNYWSAYKKRKTMATKKAKTVKKKVIKKRKKLVSGETFWFIAHTFVLTKEEKSGKMPYVDLNFDESMLVISEAESYDPETDTESNCFRTKREAVKALKEIRKLLKYKG